MGRGQGSDFGATGLARRGVGVEASGSPHPQSFPEEPVARALHRSPAVTFGTGASHHVGPIGLRRVGFASLPRLQMTVTCKAPDLPGVMPVCRQAAFSWLAERGVADEHLAFRPFVAQGSRRQAFTDQHGERRMGEAHEVSFDISEALAAGVEWDWRGHGTLKAGWQVAEGAPSALTGALAPESASEPSPTPSPAVDGAGVAGGTPPAGPPSTGAPPQGSDGPDDLRLPSGKSGFAQGEVPPPEALALADDMLLRLADASTGGWARESVAGWDVETFSARGAQDGAESEAGWDWLHDEHEAKAADGASAIFGDPEDGHFASLAPTPEG